MLWNREAFNLLIQAVRFIWDQIIIIWKWNFMKYLPNEFHAPEQKISSL